MLKVNEIFGPTIQGEGKSAGMPVIFLRLALCNLHCIWCDTPHTWNWFGNKQDHPVKYDMTKELHAMEVSEVFEKIISLAGDIKKLIISGGEPLLQQRKLIPLIQMLKNIGWSVEVETNGTVAPSVEFLELVDQINCSPKLKNSLDSAELRIKVRALEVLALSDKVNFKFVVSNQFDMEEILQIVEFIRSFGVPDIRLMPLSQTKEELLSREQMVKDLCAKHNFIYCTRLSILISGTKRGI